MLRREYFLTEAVRLITKGPIADEDDPVLNLYGIQLKYNDPTYPLTGSFYSKHYLNWVKARRWLRPEGYLSVAQRGSRASPLLQREGI